MERPKALMQLECCLCVGRSLPRLGMVFVDRNIHVYGVYELLLRLPPPVLFRLFLCIYMQGHMVIDRDEVLEARIADSFITVERFLNRADLIS